MRSQPSEESAVRGSTGLVFDERMLLHRDPEDDHPEQPLRLKHLMQRFSEAGLLERCTLVKPGETPVEALGQTHSPNLLEFLEHIASRPQLGKEN